MQKVTFHHHNPRPHHSQGLGSTLTAPTLPSEKGQPPFLRYCCRDF